MNGHSSKAHGDYAVWHSAVALLLRSCSRVLCMHSCFLPQCAAVQLVLCLRIHMHVANKLYSIPSLPLLQQCADAARLLPRSRSYEGAMHCNMACCMQAVWCASLV
jgi:hypothetical protein